MLLNQNSIIGKTGTQHQLAATTLPEGAANTAITWSSTDTGVATVSEGLVSIIDQGSCEIIATSENGKLAKCKVTATRAEVDSIILSAQVIELFVGENAKIDASILPMNAFDKTLRWSSSSGAVSVSDGSIRALSVGSSVITATASNGVKSTVGVRVTEPEPAPTHPLLIETLMSQYANSPKIVSMLNELGQSIDPSKNIQGFYNIAWNLATAQGFGLDIWGRIVGIQRSVSFPDPKGDYFGFKDSGLKPFNQAPFSGAGSKFSAYDLPDEQYRTLIMIKAMSNIIYATAPNINKLLKYIFKGKAYFLLVGHMKARYFFEFILSPFERAIVYELDILPRPCGVLLDYREYNIKTQFGFAGTGLQPFNQGTFA